MKRFQLAAVTASVFLFGGCASHITYDYYEPSGAGEIMTDLSGHKDPNNLEYVMFEQGDESVFLFCNDIGVKDTWSPVYPDTTPKPCIGVIVKSKGNTSVRSADEISDYLKRSLSIVVGGRTYQPLRVRVMPTSFRFEAYVDFVEETQPVSQFELLLKLRNGEERRILFTKKHHDEWYVKKLMG